MTTISEKIFRLGLAVLDEVLLHRNVTKKIEVSIEDSLVLSNMIVHVHPHAIFTFDEDEIKEFYELWRKIKKK